MKKLLFAVLLILAMAHNAGAKPVKNNTLVKNLVTAMKGSHTSTVVKNGSYSKVSFLFNNKTVSAFYDAENDELIGFSMPMSVSDFAQETVQKMQTKFQKYTFQEAIMFIEKNGVSEFYISLSSPQKPTIIATINANGKAYYFGLR